MEERTPRPAGASAPAAVAPFDRALLLAGILSAGATAVLAATYRRPDGAEAWDGDAALFYRMAEERPWRPGGWWRYRVLVPWLVSVLPVSVNLGYLLVSALSVAAAGPLLSLLLRDLGFAPAARTAGVVLYLASFAPLYNCYNYALPDPVAMAVLLLASRALVRGRDLELAAWLAAGVVTKEVVLFLVPVRFLWRKASWTDLREAGRTAAVAAPAAAIFLGLRTLPGEAAALGGLAQMDAWLFPWKYQADNLGRLFSPFGAGWGLVLLGCMAPSKWIRAGAPFALLVAACLLVTDAGRMLVYLMPFAVPAMAEGAGLGTGAAGRPSGRSLAALALAVLSLKLWDPFLSLGWIPEGIRRPAALLLVPAVLALAWRARRPVGAPAGP